MMDFNFLADADRTALQLENAKRALESAKAALESAKQDYDELLVRAEELGIPRAKLRKLTDDRIQSLSESGMLELKSAGAASAPKAAAKPRKPKAAKAPSAAEQEFMEEDSASGGESEAAQANA